MQYQDAQWHAAEDQAARGNAATYLTALGVDLTPSEQADHIYELLRALSYSENRSKKIAAEFERAASAELYLEKEGDLPF